MFKKLTSVLKNKKDKKETEKNSKGKEENGKMAAHTLSSDAAGKIREGTSPSPFSSFPKIPKPPILLSLSHYSTLHPSP